MNYLKKAVRYINISDFINSGGHLSLGYEYGMETIACATDEGGVVWEGKSEYESLDALLEDAEDGIKKWIEENW
ncbi:MAG: hypothetical protein AAF546_12615 [Verrucomicrobiota bacterium]